MHDRRGGRCLSKLVGMSFTAVPAACHTRETLPDAVPMTDADLAAAATPRPRACSYTRHTSRFL